MEPKAGPPALRPPTFTPGRHTKHLVTVAQTCRFLGLRDYPVPIDKAALPHLANWTNFRRFFLPLVASVNPSACRLRLETLARAKWVAVVGEGQPTTSFFNKPRNNRVRLNVTRI